MKRTPRNTSRPLARKRGSHCLRAVHASVPAPPTSPGVKAKSPEMATDMQWSDDVGLPVPTDVYTGGGRETLWQRRVRSRLESKGKTRQQQVNNSRNKDIMSGQDEKNSPLFSVRDLFQTPPSPQEQAKRGESAPVPTLKPDSEPKPAVIEAGTRSEPAAEGDNDRPWKDESLISWMSDLITPPATPRRPKTGFRLEPSPGRVHTMESLRAEFECIADDLMPGWRG